MPSSSPSRPSPAEVGPAAAKADTASPPGRLSLRRRLLYVGILLYLLLLAFSHFVRAFSPPPELSPDERSVEVREVRGTRRGARSVRLVLRESRPVEPTGEPILLIHGSPGSGSNFDNLTPHLARSRRVLAPDLPGFGSSSLRLPDYSIKAHADYLLQLLDAVGIERAHLVGFSMGGGVALEIWHVAPERVVSVTLLSSIGVQELELLGDYHLNHLVHGLQLAALWLLQEGTPHMGALDRFPLNVSYARSFFDSDQRPLRGILRQLEPPVFILHGERDPLVPATAALEHHRLVPQSELVMLEASHFFVFTRGEEVATSLEEFFDRVESGAAPRRSDAPADRRRAAARQFDPSSLPAWTGPAVLAVMLLLALATLVSEDLTCIGAGLLVAQGRLAFFPATLACGIGILLGDFLFFWLGRLLGRPALALPPLRWWITEQALEESSAWLRRRGPWVIALSRFLPGTRVATYVAAGVLRTSFLIFSFYFVIAVALWTPLLVLLASKVGQVALQRLGDIQHQALWAMLILAAIMVFARSVLLPLSTHRGRRRWAGRWRRLRSWEFWPAWLFYPPVVGYVLLLGLRHRSLTLFSAANPGIPAGGFIGESKSDILATFRGNPELLPRWRRIDGDLDLQQKLALVESFRQREELDYPLVLKPDAGQRGTGVAIIRSPEEEREFFLRESRTAILQEYVAGREFGIFYYRLPHDERGEILSINSKILPTVRGDGRRTLEELVYDDPRAVAMADVYLHQLGDRRSKVPDAGTEVPLVEVAAHARGAIFLDASHLSTDALVRRIDEIARSFPGFDFGRFDVRVPSIDALQRGEGLKIIELNGVTSEATHLYDPKHSLLRAWRILFEQWRIAFEIGAQRRADGHQPTPLPELLQMIRDYRREKRRDRGRT